MRIVRARPALTICLRRTGCPKNWLALLGIAGRTERESRRIDVKRVWLSNLALLLGCLGTTTACGQYPGAYGSLAPSAYPVQYPQPQMNQLQFSQPAFQQFGQAPAPQNRMESAPAYMTGVPTNMPTSGGYVAFTPNQTYMIPNGGMPGASQPGWLGQRNAAFQLTGTQENVNAVPAYAAPMNTVQSNAIPIPAPINAPMQTGPQSILESDSPLQHSMHGTVQNQSQPQTYQPAPNAPMMNPMYGHSIAPGCTSCGSAPLTESYGYPVYGGQPYQQTYQQSYAPHIGSRFSNHAHGSTFTGLPAGAKPYFGGASVLFFYRVDDDNVNLVYDTNYPTDNLLGTRDSRSGMMPGFEVFMGRYFNSGRNAVTASYWGLFPEDEMETVTTAGGADLRSRYQFTGARMRAFGSYSDTPVYDWYDTYDDPATANDNNTTSQAQRIDRTSNYQNVEGNLLGFMTGGAARSFYLPTSGSMFAGTRGLHGGLGGGLGGGHGHGGGCGYCGGSGCGACGGQGDCGTCNACPPTRFATGPCCLTPGCGSRLNMTWLAGVRYFRFTDTLTYASSLSDTTFGTGNDDIYYDNSVVNELIGGQLGGILNYCTGKRASLYALTKMGLYGNHARFTSDLGTYNGNSAYVTNGGVQANYMISNSKTDVAFIGEFGTGVNYRLTSKWSANCGYRAIVASGVATAVDQLPINMTHLGNASDFDNNAALILHGVNLGAQYNY
jgi:Putative beta barrel porin-7 (BBP7)